MSEVADYQTTYPNHNIGLRANGWVGIDCDNYVTPEGITKRGWWTIKAAEQLWGPLPPTLRSTAREAAGASGIYFYRAPEGFLGLETQLILPDPETGEKLADVEIIQWHHRYAIVPGSIHPALRQPYRLLDGTTVVDTVPKLESLPWLPQGWLDGLRATSADYDTRDPIQVPPQRAERSQWHHLVHAHHMGGLAALGAVGSRHDNMGRTLGRLARDEERRLTGATSAIEDLRVRFAEAVNGPNRDGLAEFDRMVEFSRRQAASTASIADAEKRRVLAALDVGQGKATSEGPDGEPVVIEIPAPTMQTMALADGKRPSDAGNSIRLAELLAGRAKFVHEWSKWIVYRDGVWLIDSADALMIDRARGVPEQLFRTGIDLDTGLRDEMLKWAKRSESAGALSAMVKVARGRDEIVISHEDLNRHHWLLNVANGVVDLRTGALLPHDPTYLFTVKAPTTFDPSARAPVFLEALERWQPEPTIRIYLQTVVGSGATGEAVEIVAFNVGSGANGKSKFFGAVRSTLGSGLVTEPHKSLLIATRNEPHPTVRADLYGKRLLVAPETEAGDRLAEASLKELVGGDPLTGRRMREDPWSFMPTHTLVMHSNYKPSVKGTDEGIWRRLQLVEWSVTIPEAERDIHLAEKLAAEASGILNWIVEGAQRFATDGLVAPELVAVSTAKYRDEEDHLGRFVEERCQLNRDASIESTPFRAAYEGWCSEEGIQPLAAKFLIAGLRRFGVERVVKGRRRFTGIRLLQNDMDYT